MTEEYTIIVDTREQTPLFKETQKSIERNTLKVGDYSIKGHETKFAIERKSGMDLFGTLGAGHIRFKKELEKALEYDYFAILVECPFTHIKTKTFTGAYFSKMKGHVVTSILFTIHMKYKVPVFFARDRKEAKSLVREICKSYIKNL